ncbi:MAG: hypothetical protein JEZ07_01015 [Phycisphaerae bacterium]|nr:hypothetical protein [Phycisphaerae bacterium]
MNFSGVVAACIGLDVISGRQMLLSRSSILLDIGFIATKLEYNDKQDAYPAWLIVRRARYYGIYSSVMTHSNKWAGRP